MKACIGKFCFTVFTVSLVIVLASCDSSSPNEPPRPPPVTPPGGGGGSQPGAWPDFEFPFVLPENNITIESGITISQTGNGNYPTAGTLTLINYEYFTLIEWFLGSVKLGEGPVLELDARNVLYNVQGTHNITVVVWQDGVPHSLRILFTVVE